MDGADIVTLRGGARGKTGEIKQAGQVRGRARLRPVLELVELEDVAVGIADEAGQAAAPVDRPLGDRHAFAPRPVEDEVEPVDDERGVGVARPFDRVVEQHIVRRWLGERR